MRAVFAKVPPSLIEDRKRTGAHQWDEMWEGELHMPPMPNRWHQELEYGLLHWLKTNWGRPQGNKVHHQVNVAPPGGWPNDYRIPDIILLTPDRFHIDHIDYCEGAPNVVVEIHSPDDESYEKLEFYAELGVPEVWIIDRATGTAEIFVLSGDSYRARPPTSDGRVLSPVTGVEMRRGAEDRLSIRMANDPTTQQDLPPD